MSDPVIGLAFLDAADRRGLSRILARTAAASAPDVAAVLGALAESAPTGTLTAPAALLGGTMPAAVRQALEAAHQQARISGSPDTDALCHVLAGWCVWEHHHGRQ